MMNRRKFFRLAFAGAASAVVAPKLVLASSSGGAESAMAGGVFFTKAAPGRWSKKVDGHLPQIEITKGGAGSILKVITAHTMDSHAHYIVKHVVLDKDFNFIAEYMFDPIKDKAAISEISVGAYRGVVNVLSVCNKHDTWLNTAEV